MSKYVVSSITYGSTTGYAKSHSTTLVPEISEVESKANINEVERKEKRLKDAIKEESYTREKNDSAIQERLLKITESLKNYVDNQTLQKFKSDLLANDRLSMEKKILQGLIDNLLIEIQKRCEAERVLIQKEVEGFKQIDLNRELSTKLQPITNLLGTISEKSKIIETELLKIGSLKQYFESIENKIKQASINIEELYSIRDFIKKTQLETNNNKEELKKTECKITEQIERYSFLSKQIEQVVPLITQNDLLELLAVQIKTAQTILVDLQSEKKDYENRSILNNEREIQLKNEIEAKLQAQISHLRIFLYDEIKADIEKENSQKSFFKRLFKK